MKVSKVRLARHYALDRLARELPPTLVYHNFEHTFRVVLPAAQFLCAREAVTPAQEQLTLTAVLFHDLGYTASVDQYKDHEALSAGVAAQVLPRFGYGPEKVATIQRLILATHLPHNPQDLMEEIMADADLDVLGRRDFARFNAALRREWENLGRHYSDSEWYTQQIEFMLAHHYFTHSARLRRDTRKAANIALVARRLQVVQQA